MIVKATKRDHETVTIGKPQFDLTYEITGPYVTATLSDVAYNRQAKVEISMEEAVTIVKTLATAFKMEASGLNFSE